MVRKLILGLAGIIVALAGAAAGPETCRAG